MDHSYPYIASLTREPFLFYEMSSTAKLMSEGLSDEAIVTEIVEQNDTVASWSDSTITKLKQLIAIALCKKDYAEKEMPIDFSHHPLLNYGNKIEKAY